MFRNLINIRSTGTVDFLYGLTADVMMVQTAGIRLGGRD